ncbi:MAG TPA: 2-C-methyl-D-erythritol 2,4-cyclodiphosphate synthase [candidate division WOR-3 bacterium]|uniref:2-C-methyl-D-erythritol 2,4-cyclodiphosphate synthase n=1 Tax=candidate division WOR-3 bacterium TaxID=2052148 RepID=A0A7V0T6C8_UNCW3|nr:2-C-methyl-D-erythritol 2,4-cyclodiphosphate synthase [candidate division WOR-3 bacterium]
MNAELRIGLGFDAHRLAAGRPLMLGGVDLGFERGLAGHSDGDALLHALSDALLGSLGLPDIGTLFPDDDPNYKGADSARLLTEVLERVRAAGGRPVNVDVVVVCDRPKLQPHVPAIRTRLAGLLGLAPDAVGIKAKTTEGTAIADRESIAVMATVLVRVAS